MIHQGVERCKDKQSSRNGTPHGTAILQIGGYGPTGIGSVGFKMTARGRREGETVGMVTRSETEVETGRQQLAGQGGTTAETVDGPARGRTQTLVHAQQHIERPDAMDGDRQGIPLGQSDLPPEDFLLHAESCTPQAVQSALAYGNDSTTLYKTLQPLEKRLRIVAGPPRMDAGGIKHTGTGRKVGGTQ